MFLLIVVALFLPGVAYDFLNPVPLTELPRPADANYHAYKCLLTLSIIIKELSLRKSLISGHLNCHIFEVPN